MGKTRPPERSKLARRTKAQQSAARRAAAGPPPAALLEEATALLARSDAAAALELATRALQRLKSAIRVDDATGDVDEDTVVACLPALNLLGEICVELGDADAARRYFGQAADIDDEGGVPEARGGGADKFMWLAQLSEEGGADSLRWLEKGAGVLRAQIAELEGKGAAVDEEALTAKRTSLAKALCLLAEVFMTDLSWEDEAEARCSEAVEEAVRVAPANPEALQTMASVRISQCRLDEARELLRKSMALWQDLPAGSTKVPDFAVRISLVRLLMDADMERDAAAVLDRLVLEDDTSVEAWYLGGWCANVTATKARAANGASDPADEEELLKRAKKWLQECLVLYDKLEYEDEPLHDHAVEILKTLDEVVVSSDDEESGAEWEEESDDNEANDSDEDMDDE
jgi:tetratricopeptide (TPR) repeat protein